MLKMNTTSDAMFSSNEAILNPNDATLDLNNAILSSHCFITIYFSNQVSTSPYHSVIYCNVAISLLAGLCCYKFVIFIIYYHI